VRLELLERILQKFQVEIKLFDAQRAERLRFNGSRVMANKGYCVCWMRREFVRVDFIAARLCYTNVRKVRVVCSVTLDTGSKCLSSARMVDGLNDFTSWPPHVWQSYVPASSNCLCLSYDFSTSQFSLFVSLRALRLKVARLVHSKRFSVASSLETVYRRHYSEFSTDLSNLEAKYRNINLEQFCALSQAQAILATGSHFRLVELPVV